MRQQWASDKASHAAAAAASSAAALAAAASIHDGDSIAPNAPKEVDSAFQQPLPRVPVLSLPTQPVLTEGSGSSRLHRYRMTSFVLFTKCEV